MDHWKVDSTRRRTVSSSFGTAWPRLGQGSIDSIVSHVLICSQCSVHIATRDKNAVKSHAQKYFIKLYVTGKPLPAKVQESGTGHTLSGKVLDPESGSLHCKRTVTDLLLCEGAALQYMGKKRKKPEDK